MTATTAQAAKASTTTPVQIGKGKEESNTNGFANLLASTISETDKGKPTGKAVALVPMLDIPADTKKSSVDTLKVPVDTKKTQVLGEYAKGKGLTGEIDLSLLGEVDPALEGKGTAKKLGDILAELSHKSDAPIGSEVINLKTVLSSKNDDPDLISKDLIGMVAAKDQKKVMSALIGGAKQLLTEQLESRIPKNRVPKTLKGLLETAIRFNMVVNDITLESLPESKVTKGLLAALEKKGKQDPALPMLASKMILDDKQVDKLKTAVTEKSPLEKMLKGKADAADEITFIDHKEAIKGKGAGKEGVQTAKELATAKSMESTPVQTGSVKEKDKSKVDKKEDIKLAAKDTVRQESVKNAPVTNQTAVNKQNTQRGSALEKLLATEGESTSTEAKSSQETTSSTTAVRQEGVAVKSDTPMGVKMAEARQLVSQLSADVKEAMENYKPPFTKLSMKLNPERMGEIDVMMVQRGNNVHINLTSNGVALGLLQQNAAELKNALSEAGLGDASMNFTSNGEGRNPSQEEQQKHTTSEHYAEMSKILEDIDTLELVVPRYV